MFVCGILAVEDIEEGSIKQMERRIEANIDKDCLSGRGGGHTHTQRLMSSHQRKN